MMDVSVNPLIFAGTALTVIMGSMLANQGARADRRAKQLAAAAALLDAHLKAVEAFCDSPDAPENLQQILLDVSDALEDRTFVTETFSHFRQRLADRASSATGYSQPEGLEDLRRASPQTAELFSNALTAGMFSAFMHWPECAEGLEESLRFLADPREQLSLAGALAALRPTKGFDGWTAQAA